MEKFAVISPQLAKGVPFQLHRSDMSAALIKKKQFQLHRRCTERADKEEIKAVEVSDMFFNVQSPDYNSIFCGPDPTWSRMYCPLAQ